MRRLLSPIFLLSGIVGFAVTGSAQTSYVEQHLRDQFRSKTLLLRKFYSGDHLLYDSAGGLIGKEMVGDWTSDGFVVLDEFRTSGPRLIIEARRLLVTRSTPEFAFGAAKRRSADGKDLGPALVEIDVDFGTAAPSVEEADAAISRIFLNEQDSLVDLVPDYWRPCVLGGLSWKNETCRFSPEVIAIPGVALSDKNHGIQAAPGNGLAPPGQVFLVGKGVSPPKPISCPEPEFSEEARAAKYQGITSLGLIVNVEGKPTRIRILSPLGAGLDAQAVRAVEKWRFAPAEKDGEPVPVEIAVEVNFHLY